MSLPTRARDVRTSRACTLLLVIGCADTSSALSVAITGTNSGIGKAAASLLLKDGHTVYHACRTAEGAQQAVEAAGGGTPMVCDLADLSSFPSFPTTYTVSRASICPGAFNAIAVCVSRLALRDVDMKEVVLGWGGKLNETQWVVLDVIRSVFC